MNSRVPLYAACVIMSLMLLPACSSKKSPTPTDEAAVTPTEKTPGEALDKDVMGENYAQPGQPLPTDADIPAVSAGLPGSSAAASFQAQPGSMGYPDYDAGSPRAHGKGSGKGSSSGGGGGSYSVKAGDSLWTISRKNGTTVHALASANNLSEKAVLRVGQKLTIPSGSSVSSSKTSPTSKSSKTSKTSKTSSVSSPSKSSSVPSPSKTADSSSASSGGTYKVQHGDTYATIAHKHGTTAKKLKEANGATSDVLHEGQTLKLP